MSLRLCLLAALVALAPLVPAGAAAPTATNPRRWWPAASTTPATSTSAAGERSTSSRPGAAAKAPASPGRWGPRALAPSGAVTRIRHGDQRRVLAGLPSLARAAGGRRSDRPVGHLAALVGGAYLTVGLGQNPAARAQLGALARPSASSTRSPPSGTCGSSRTSAPTRPRLTPTAARSTATRTR